MEVKDFLRQTMEKLMECLVLLQEDEVEKAFDVCRENLKDYQLFILFLEDNQVLKEEEIQQIATLLLQAMENEDAFLLQDVLRYGLLDIINQLEGA